MDHYFASLVLGLAGQAESALTGALPPGAEEAGVKDARQLAKSFIDTLSMLEAKTKGNLDADEAKLLGEALTGLRFRFVQSEKR